MLERVLTWLTFQHNKTVSENSITHLYHSNSTLVNKQVGNQRKDSHFGYSYLQCSYSHTKYSRCTKDRKEKGYCYFPLLLLFYCLPVLQALLPQASSHYWSVFYALTKEICKKSKVSHLHLMGAHLLLSYTAIHLTKHEPSGPEGPRTPPLNPKLNTLRTLPP